VCNLGGSAELCETDGAGCNSFTKNCVAEKASRTDDSGSLLALQNPTCNSRQYSGGLMCCSHGRILLDADQISAATDLLRYHMKLRFWFEEFVANGSATSAPHARAGTSPSHNDLGGKPYYYQQTEADASEYDVPPAFRANEAEQIVGYPDWPVGKPTPGTTCTGDCPSGASCDCVHSISYNWTYSNARLIYANGHCHAPSCFGIWLFRNDVGHEMELLCHQAPVWGQGNVTEGVAVVNRTDSDKFDEAAYITLPPCLWGDDAGLKPSVLLPPNTPMVSIKKNHNTRMGHFGEMASWQMRGVDY